MIQNQVAVRGSISRTNRALQLCNLFFQTNSRVGHFP